MAALAACGRAAARAAAAHTVVASMSSAAASGLPRAVAMRRILAAAAVGSLQTGVWQTAGSRMCFSTRGKETHTFQAETKQLLNIVTNSLYTDKHIFIRELISNASDALEKVRHLQATGKHVADPKLPLEIRITTDHKANTVTIEDTGIGMTKDEMIANIGTIAHSGSRAFVKEMGSNTKDELAANIIGQFGVGFYSSFMVSSNVEVTSKSGTAPEAGAHEWHSSGDGTYTIEPTSSSHQRGTKIVIHLNDADKQFAIEQTVKNVILQYSYFVQFPIFLNEVQINTVKAVWSMHKNDVTEDMYQSFYKTISKRYDTPRYRLHFRTDVPVDLKALFYVGEQHEEKFNQGVQKRGVSLYSHRVLIEHQSEIVPHWLRFLYGVVDSEDIPLNISRESMQDSALIQRIRSTLTRRVIKFFDDEGKRDRKAYDAFFMEFGHFIKEGAVSESTLQEPIAKLLRFESSVLPPGEITSLDEYISRCEPSQKNIYYLVAPDRKLAESSPYMEGFRGSDTQKEIEVLFMYSAIDDFVMHQLGRYNDRVVASVETGSEQLEKDAGTTKEARAKTEEKKDGADAGSSPDAALTEAQVTDLGRWMVDEALPSRLSAVVATSRLRQSPAMITDHESASFRRLNMVVNAQKSVDGLGQIKERGLPPQKLEINPAHPVIVGLFRVRQSQPELAKLVAEQVFDNALVAAGLLDDSRIMLPRLNEILASVVKSN